ncbi:MAG: hypothetical protein QME25_01865 [Bacteroidota bacterium]|nr:hypothetical protein [Bacteroidota bacterium]
MKYDVYGEDPTVNKLQDKVASLFGKEDAHIFVYENAAPAALSGVSVKTVHGDNGVITAEHKAYLS